MAPPVNYFKCLCDSSNVPIFAAEIVLLALFCASSVFFGFTRLLLLLSCIFSFDCYCYLVEAFFSDSSGFEF